MIELFPKVMSVVSFQHYNNASSFINNNNIFIFILFHPPLNVNLNFYIMFWYSGWILFRPFGNSQRQLYTEPMNVKLELKINKRIGYKLESKITTLCFKFPPEYFFHCFSNSLCILLQALVQRYIIIASRMKNISPCI